jgi:hypothetical protein
LSSSSTSRRRVVIVDVDLIVDQRVDLDGDERRR